MVAQQPHLPVCEAEAGRVHGPDPVPAVGRFQILVRAGGETVDLTKNLCRECHRQAVSDAEELPGGVAVRKHYSGGESLVTVIGRFPRQREAR